MGYEELVGQALIIVAGDLLSGRQDNFIAPESVLTVPGLAAGVDRVRFGDGRVVKAAEEVDRVDNKGHELDGPILHPDKVLSGGIRTEPSDHHILAVDHAAVEDLHYGVSELLH